MKRFFTVMTLILVALVSLLLTACASEGPEGTPIFTTMQMPKQANASCTQHAKPVIVSAQPQHIMIASKAPSAKNKSKKPVKKMITESKQPNKSQPMQKKMATESHQPNSQKTYILQIAASHNLPALKNYVQQQHLVGQVAFYQESYQGQPWYVLAYGTYPNVAAANRALANLPSRLKQQGLQPWVRPLT